MRLVIECIERVGIAQDLLKLLAAQNINLEAIELEKLTDKGVIYLRTEKVDPQSTVQLMAKIKQIESVLNVRVTQHLPQERKQLELQALLESLPNPVLSIDIYGNITFANSQACKLLLPLYRLNFPKRKQEHIQQLEQLPLCDVMPNLNRTKWYAAYLAKGRSMSLERLQPISHPTQFNEQLWQLDLLPLALHEEQHNQIIGYVVNLQSQKMQLNLRQFMASQQSEFAQIVAQSIKMQAVIEQAKKFSLLDAPLLIQGETGTGKDLFAKACHQFSFRREQKFIAVNCAGLPAENAESEMFGYRGNGGTSTGFFEYANGGTVLLDAVSELSLEMQAKLLRFLNDGSFRRVGEDKEIQVNVRVICTTQKPLASLVAEGKLREDLYHRLNVLSLNLPPLRERQGDLPLLVEHFVSKISQQLAIDKPNYSQGFIQALQNYSWPGNLRELHNAIYRACSLSNGQLFIADLGLPDDVPNEFNLDNLANSSLEELVDRFEASLLRKFYAEYPSTRKLAQRLGLSHTAVANKLRLYGINK